MTELNEILSKHNLVKTQCAIIVNADAIEGTEETKAFQHLLDHCQLFAGKKRSDVVKNSMDLVGYHYDRIMPTIEFHPMHRANEGLFVPKNIHQHSIYWVIDTVEDLRLAADLRPAGIVSNTPQQIMQIIKGGMWCQSS